MTESATFQQLLEKLTAEHFMPVTRESGNTLMAQKGLLQQLREAVFSGMENTGGGASFGSKPPIDAAATDLLTEITNQATEALASVSNMPTPYGHAEAYVRLWAGQTRDDFVVTVSTRMPVENPTEGKPAVFDQLTQLTSYELLARWVERIEDFFNPPSSREIQAPCPHCNNRYVYRQKDGQQVRSAALNFHRSRETGETVEARCSACGVAWTPDLFEHLAVVLGGKTSDQVRDEWAAKDAAEAEREARKAKTRAKREHADTPE
jgi:hypothetical protein